MSSINSLLNAGSSSVTGSSVANNALDKLNEKLSEIESDTTKSDEYKQKQIEKINGQMSTAANVQANIANASNLINGMLGKTDVVDFGMFFGTDLGTVRTLFSASMQSQKEARLLASEISLDKMRGNDTSDKEEKLSNMSANISILNNSLNSRINDVLANEDTDRDTRSVIDKIKDQLDINQKKLDKEFGKVSGDEKTDKTETESSSSTGKTEKKEPEPSVIDKINAGLEENQKKLDEEFSNKV